MQIPPYFLTGSLIHFLIKPILWFIWHAHMHNSLTYRSHSPSNSQEEFLLKILKFIILETIDNLWELWLNLFSSFSSPEPTILLACGKDCELWLEPIFWVCAEYSFRILNQSDLPDLTGSPWITHFRCWSKPELLNPAIGQKGRGLWGRECILVYKNTKVLSFHLKLKIANISWEQVVTIRQR